MGSKKKAKFDEPPKVQFPEWLQDHPAVKMFEGMRLKDFAMICHFFGYMMIPEAKIKKLVENATLLKAVLPTDGQMSTMKRTVDAISAAKVNSKGKGKTWHKKPLRKKK